MSENPFFHFSDDIKLQAIDCQNHRCASCGISLQATELKTDAHHVHPQQTGQLNAADRQFLASVDNCVILCGAEWEDDDYQMCHWYVHEGGKFRDGAVAGPDRFSFSHGEENSSEHLAWSQQINMRWEKRRLSYQQSSVQSEKTDQLSSNIKTSQSSRLTIKRKNEPPRMR